jgi:hypothetical protein
MSRLIALVKDPTAGGSTYDELSKETSPVKVPAPVMFVPATAATMEPGVIELNRNDEVRGRRSNVPPMSFAAMPVGTINARAYPKLMKELYATAMGGTITQTGTVPAAITSKWSTLQSGNLPMLVVWLLREEQLDRLTGAVVSELEINMPVDQEGQLKANFEALYYDTDKPSEAKDPGKGGVGEAAEPIPEAKYEGFENTFTLRDAVIKTGSTETELASLSGFQMTFNNGMIVDHQSKFRPGHNIEKVTIDSIPHKLWFPAYHKLGAQNITGKIDLSQVESLREIRRKFTHAEQLILTCTAGPIEPATTPPAEEAIKFVLYKHALTGGGADPLVREGDQRASYNFSGYLDSTLGKDFEAQFTGAAEVKIV